MTRRQERERTGPGPWLGLRPGPEGGPTVLEISGRLGVREVAPLMAALARTLHSAPHHLVVCDLTALQAPAEDFVLAAFPAALRRAGGWPAVSAHLVVPDPALEGRLRSLRIHRYLPVHATYAAALAAAELDLAGRRVRLGLPALARSPAVARGALAELWPRGALPGREDALLVVSELVSNAVRHAATPLVVDLALSPHRLLVAVTDADPAEPVLRAPGDPGGLGMNLVGRLAEDWGVRLVHRGGKTVWAAMAPPRLLPVARPAPA